jgi:hypothetical protein
MFVLPCCLFFLGFSPLCEGINLPTDVSAIGAKNDIIEAKAQPQIMAVLARSEHERFEGR